MNFMFLLYRRCIGTKEDPVSRLLPGSHLSCEKENRTGKCFASSGFTGSTRSSNPPRDLLHHLVRTACFEKADSPKPTPIANNPSMAINGNELAPFGRDVATGAAAGSVVTTGGGSTTWASSTGSPVGATASIGAVF